MKTSTEKKELGVYVPVPLCIDDLGSWQGGRSCKQQIVLFSKMPVCSRPGYPAVNPLFYICEVKMLISYSRSSYFRGEIGAPVIKPGTYAFNQTIFFPGLSNAENLVVDVSEKLLLVHQRYYTFQGQYRTTIIVNNESNRSITCWQLEYNIEKVPATCTS